MLPLDADPVLVEASEIARELRRTRAAVLTDCARIFGDESAEILRSRLADATVKRAEELASDAPAELRVLLDEFAALTRRRAGLLRDPDRRDLVERALTDRACTLRTAVAFRRQLEQRTERRASARDIVDRAARSTRPLTSGERARTDELLHDATHGTSFPRIATRADRDVVFDALSTLELRRAGRELRAGLLETPQMRAIIREALPALHRGEPLLLIGETGGAKTALAEHLAHRAMGLRSELISGYGDITSAQVLGSYQLRAADGATTSVFVPGPLVRAMTDGHPVILDEINAMPPEFLKRLNRILQLRPGDTFALQENAGAPLTIAPGFVVLATANEQTPHRYRGLEQLSAELVNRFGANSYRVRYPDSGLDYTDFPAENALLAAAAVADRHGRMPEEVSPEDLTRVARAAFISQQIFSGAHGEGFGDYVSSERTIDGRPGLEEAVLAPRTLVAILTKVMGSAGTISLEHALGRFVEGVLHREDRHVLALILEGQGFRVGR